MSVHTEKKNVELWVPDKSMGDFKHVTTNCELITDGVSLPEYSYTFTPKKDVLLTGLYGNVIARVGSVPQACNLRIELMDALGAGFGQSANWNLPFDDLVLNPTNSPLLSYVFPFTFGPGMPQFVPMNLRLQSNVAYLVSHYVYENFAAGVTVQFSSGLQYCFLQR